jgi:hypothetical protein
VFALCTSGVSWAGVRGGNCYPEHFKQSLKGHDILNTYLCMLPSIYCYNWKVEAKNFESFKENYQKLFNLYGFSKFDFINERDRFSDTQVIIMSNDKMVMVVFRGSETKFNKDNFASSVRDWITTDFAIGKTKVDKWGKGVKIHRGFYRALNLVYDDFKKKCSEHIGLTNKPLWVTGHSLGGALATLAAFRLETDGIAVHQIEVFGSPRVGNDKFLKAYGSKVSQIFRWVHQNDLITMVPPRKVFKYCHVTRPSMIYTDGKKVLFADENNEKGKVSDHMGPDYGAALFKALPAASQKLVPDDEDSYDNYEKIIKRSQEQENELKPNGTTDGNPDRNLPILPKKPGKEAEKDKIVPPLPEKTLKLLETL